MESKPKFRETKSIDGVKTIELLCENNRERSPERYQDEFSVKVEAETATFERENDRDIKSVSHENGDENGRLYIVRRFDEKNRPRFDPPQSPKKSDKNWVCSNVNTGNVTSFLFRL